MNLSVTGKNISDNSAITAITNIGFFILIKDKEYFVPFSEYPLFRKATIEIIYNYKMLSPKQIYWEALDCDIELEALEKPDQFTLIYK